MVPEAELRRAARRPAGGRLSDHGTIPVIDLGLPREEAVRRLRFALTEIGFYFIVNHGVSPALVRDTFGQAARFHGQPLDAKMQVRIDKHNVGYLPLRGDTLRTSVVQTVTRPNLNEAFFVARDLAPDHPDVVADRRFRSANRWPAALPGFRETVIGYCDTMERLVQRLVPLYAQALGLPAAYFDEAFRESQYKLRMTHYPNQPASLEGDYGIAPHTDTSFLTVLAPNEVPGLAIRSASGKWIDAPAIANAFVVNGGQLLRRWTNDVFLATPHRAINRSGGERYALAFFCDANIDWPIAAVPTTVAPDRPPLYPTTYYTDYMIEYQKRTYDLLAGANQQAAG